ncbi:putative PKS/NRPS-like protein biosynthetic cluster [Metarhizium acridum]|nr:putative PKS/NRPS-like protein biosynthetic cluster [Metarhizium acridum]
MYAAVSASEAALQKDNEVACTLLIELLAHQFCYPVQWIKTQDLILGGKETSRVVEFGPGNTLVKMAERTIAQKYAQQDAAANISRQLLSFQQNYDQISYEQKPVHPSSTRETEDASAGSEPKPSTLASSDSPSESAPAISVQQSSNVMAVELEDEPASAIDITTTIVCMGLKKPLDGVDTTKSIRALSGGRSTLQNEILGDLGAEFGVIPDGAEDMTINDFCSFVQGTFAGKLGAKCSSGIEKMVSQKFSGSFQGSGIRKYLKKQWGFGPGRQDSVVLWALTSQPQARLQNDDEAKIFIDGIVQQYIKKRGLVLPAESSAAGPSAAQTTVSVEVLDCLEDRQKEVFREQLELYARLLGVDLHAPEAANAALCQRISDLEEQLDGWNIEHGEAYASGLKPIFTPLKARVYDSWWNWAMQDLMLLISTATSGSLRDMEPTIDRLKRNLVQKSHSRLVCAIRHFLSTTTNVHVADTLRDVLSRCETSMNEMPVVYWHYQSMAPVTTIDQSGKIVYSERPRSLRIDDDKLLRIGHKVGNNWEYPDSLCSTLHQVLAGARTTGLSFAGRNILVTGAGEGSIGCSLVSKLLSAGAHVIVTSSSYSPRVTRFYQRLFAEHGSKGSTLILVPFNQASVRDVEALVTYIYDDGGLDMDLDHVIPFAAISENGRNLDNIDSRSELAHRVMLTNTIRLLGRVKHHKEARKIVTRPAQVILPLSPNHGKFGGDGLYAESKLGLESFFDKFHSEDWADYLLICGALIGWTRGTSLMSENDTVSEGIEKHGMRTYSQDEMALQIVALMDPAVVSLCTDEPLLADLSGGMAQIADLKGVVTGIRDCINQLGEERRMMTHEALSDAHVVSLEEEIEPQANIEFSFPALPDWKTEITPMADQLKGMVDLDHVVVVAGFAEIGPWGNSRTRWDMEVNGSLSRESCVELAWIMGLIKAHSGIVDGRPFSGWIDKNTNKPLADREIKEKYHDFIRENCGIRYAESKPDSPSWTGMESLHEIEILKDHEPVEVSNETAVQLKNIHGDNLNIMSNEGTGQSKIVLKKGAKIMIPKLQRTQHTVAGQVPTGWNPSTYGIPEEIIAQVDPVTLFALVASAEAFQSAGISDPYEFYDHLHVGEVANCTGSGFGGSASIRKMFKGRYQDQPAAKDILAESFISSTSAWINMLLMSSAGPNKTPVGACATALESLDTAFDLIHAGKAKMCLVGGFDDMLKEISDEFANLKATVNADDDAARGREPSEMSRPATSTRNGFVESEGAGVQVVTSASVALEMGLPIHAVIALTRTAMDGASRSIPAPGQGLLGSAAQTPSKYDSPLMSMAHRKRSLRKRLQQAAEMRELQISDLGEEIAHLKRQGCSFNEAEYLQDRMASIEQDAKRDRVEALKLYGNHFWIHDSRISPIRGALAVWGLTVDDIDVVSFHGTSTKANEKNESSVINEQFKHLGRKQGNVVPVVCQKSLTGHPKGAAGAWMLNGCMQLMADGRVPGNRNADNIDAALQQYDYLVFPNKTIEKPEVKAFIVQSFGFGQKGAMAIGVNPKYLYATLDEDDFVAYKQKRRLRERQTNRVSSERFFNNSIFQAKDGAPYAAADRSRVLLRAEA